MASPEILSLPPPLEDGVELHPGAGDAVALAGLEAHPELRRGLDGGERLRRGEQRLRRHAVPQHAGAAKPLVVDDHDLGPEVRRNQGGLVPSRPPANDHHSHVALHTPMLPPPAEPDRLTAPTLAPPPRSAAGRPCVGCRGRIARTCKGSSASCGAASSPGLWTTKRGCRKAALGSCHDRTHPRPSEAGATS